MNAEARAKRNILLTLTIPAPLQTFANIALPLTHSVNLARGLMLGKLETSLLISIAWIAIVTPIFFIICINAMKRKLIK
jgi:hypothetical protein